MIESESTDVINHISYYLFLQVNEKVKLFYLSLRPILK